ncbi:hypothetical protein N7448_011198 [Penicillium atrosanguineum]|nr:hypothetical protein N7448_011198 [Penicillium atrosanguineum]
MYPRVVALSSYTDVKEPSLAIYFLKKNTQMAQKKFQVSRYEMGELRENEWHCGCGHPASNFTSRKDQTKGDKLPQTADFSFGKRMNTKQGHRCPLPGPLNKIEDEPQPSSLLYPDMMLREDVEP